MEEWYSQTQRTKERKERKSQEIPKANRRNFFLDYSKVTFGYSDL